jgi:hypothetical protein
VPSFGFSAGDVRKGLLRAGVRRVAGEATPRKVSGPVISHVPSIRRSGALRPRSGASFRGWAPTVIMGARSGQAGPGGATRSRQYASMLTFKRARQGPAPSDPGGVGPGDRRQSGRGCATSPTLGSFADDEGEEGIDRSLDRTGALLYLRE